MATQKGLIIEEAGAPFKVIDTLPRPSPGHKQALVKTLRVAINPVEIFMAQTAMLTTELPAVLGSDECAVVTETGEGCTRLKKGDYVHGLSRLGQNAYSPFQESFLVDEDRIFKKPDYITPENATIIGAGLLTAAFGTVVAGQMSLPEHGSKGGELNQWILVLGGSGTVGQFAIQLGRLCGYKVLASCSPSNASSALAAGANATLDRHASMESQVAEMLKVAGGQFALVFDASAGSSDVGVQIVQQPSVEIQRFSTVGDVSSSNIPSSIKVDQVSLGQLGREGEIGTQYAEETARMIPVLERHIANGSIKAVDTEVFEGVGWDKLIEALAYYSSGKADKKIVVRVQDE